VTKHTQGEDYLRLTVDEECLKVRITEDCLKVSICEVVQVSGGGNSDNTAFFMPAETNINGLRVVVPSDTSPGHAIYADHRNILHASRVLGISKHAVLAGQAVEVMDGGSLGDPSWSWTVGPIFLGEDGKMTQTAPTIGFVLMVGKAVSATRISLNIDRPIIL